MAEQFLKKVYDCETGVEETVAMTEAEIADLLAFRKESEKNMADQLAQAKAREEARASAEAKLKTLGLSSVEISAILG